MRPFSERNLFDGIAAHVYFDRDGRRYSTLERHCFLCRQHPVGTDPGLFLQCNLFCRTRSWTGDYHHRVNPPFLTVMLVHSGETAVRCGSEYFRAEPGDAVLFHPGTDYEFMTERECEKSAVLIGGRSLAVLLQSGGLAEKMVVSLRAPERLEEYFSRIAVKLPESFRHAVRQEISGLCCEMLQFLAVPEEAHNYPFPLEQALSVIARQYAEPLTVESLAVAAGISIAGLARLFKFHLQTTPYKYLTGFRMRQAERMLEERTCSIKEIAEKVGYGNPLNFSTEFRKWHTCSPREFMNGKRNGVPESESSRGTNNGFLPER